MAFDDAEVVARLGPDDDQRLGARAVSVNAPLGEPSCSSVTRSARPAGDVEPEVPGDVADLQHLRGLELRVPPRRHPVEEVARYSPRYASSARRRSSFAAGS